MEINYDQMIMVVHDKSFTPAPGYTRQKPNYKGVLPLISATIHTDSSTYTDEFILDMGATGSMFQGSIKTVKAGIMILLS
ncbi:MAG TPA: hypothetical protein VLA58_08260 [Chitinophagaceae bacterium]|nr:hypothetical protein [Chitinophagaceae bacterium]